MNALPINDYAAPTLNALAALLERLEREHGVLTLEASALDAFSSAPGDALILLTDDPARSPETWDVAVLLPELLKRFRDRLRVAALMPAASRDVATRFGVTRYPAQLFLRGGEYVGVIDGMLDWDVWGTAVARQLDTPTGRAPSIGIALRNADAGSACH